MLWDAPSPTITTQFYGYGNGRFGHPSQDRALSLREGAILQSFPRDYKFISSTDILNKHKLGLQIGNAVPVRLGEVIGLSILEHIRRYNDGKEKVTPERSEAAERQLKDLQRQVEYDTKDYTLELLLDKFEKGDFYIRIISASLSGKLTTVLYL